ncbi:MAG: SPOR domain-containing protein, partial [Cyclobacteriaceae bacterium]|nr:SPOR domain-containing protein [Cyclobacteriaceae bacterium]
YELNEPTGRYHVIVASSIDVDLIRDYGNKLAKQGMTCNIIAPRGSKNFHRLSVADYVSLNDATVKSEQLKNDLGEDVWVIRY